MLLLCLSLLAIGALSLPAAPAGQSFSVPRVRRSDVVRNGPAAKAHVFRKYGWKLPSAPEGVEDFAFNVLDSDTLSALVTRSQSGKVFATPEQYDSEYIAPVTIGGQQLNLDFDTGSSDLWVFNTDLSQRTIGSHAAFNPSTSPTFQSLAGYTWEIEYGDGTGAEGVVGTDTVNIGGATVTRQAVELATALSSSFAQDTASDGIVGLGFSSINNVQPVQQKTFFDNLVPSLARPVFTVDLENDGSGFYQFGVINSTSYKGSLTYIGVNKTQGFWQVSSHTVSIGGEQAFNPRSSPAIADTGTSLLIVDDAVAEAYYSQVPGAGYSYYLGGYLFPCTETDLPSFALSLGNYNYMVDIPTSFLNYAPISRGYCYGGIQSNEGYPLQVYGDIMFRSAFFVFQNSTGEPLLGVAPKS